MLVRSRLYIHAAAAAVAVLAFALVATSSAWSLPLYLGNIGNFQIRADSIEGEQFELALAVDQNSGENGGALPVGEISMSRTSIDGLLLEKEFDSSALLGSAGSGPYRLSISTNGPTSIRGLGLNVAGLCADSITFGPGFAVDGKGAGTAEVTDDLSLASSTITLGRPGIEATYLTTNTITLEGIRIDIKKGAHQAAPCAR